MSVGELLPSVPWSIEGGDDPRRVAVGRLEDDVGGHTRAR